MSGCERLYYDYLEYQKAEDTRRFGWEKDDFKHGLYYGYVMGFVAGDNRRWFDIPADDEFFDIKDDLLNEVGDYLTLHPKKYELSRKQCLYDALYAIFPKD